MTRLTDTQQQALERIQHEKSEIDRVVADLQAEMDAKVAEAQRFLVEAIKNAMEVGVPKRRIHMDGLGTKDSKTLADLLAAHNVSQPQKPAQRSAGIREVQEGIWLVTARDGRTFEFFVVDLGDTTIIESSGNTDEGAATFGTTPPADVFAQLEKKFPNGDFSEFLDEEEDDD